jgi:hypothetical protein
MNMQEGGTMKKLIILSVILAVILLAENFFALVNAQDPAKEEKPTFYRLTPGVYVNGFPRFTVTYPKDWVEQRPHPQEVFRAGGPTLSAKFIVNIPFPNPQPVDKLADLLVSGFKTIAKDVTVASDKQSRLRDGTPVREVELQMVLNGVPINYLSIATKKDDMWIMTGVGSERGRMREDWEAILYSLQFEPDKDKPVKVPLDIQEFFDKVNNDIVSHDLTKVMANYSDRYLNSGTRKGEMERVWREIIGLITSIKGVVTDFVPAGDRAFVAGFVIMNIGTFPISETSIIKESGEWKWYGNQRDVSP